jgi:hypothetical protein
MNYNTEELKSLIGKSISSIAFHYWDDGENFKSLDWITFTIDGRQITYTCGAAAEDIVIHFDYSLPDIHKKLEHSLGVEHNIKIISKDFDCAQINEAKISRVLLIERLNFGYAHQGYIFFDNGKVIELTGGVDCVNIEIQNSILEIE